LLRTEGVELNDMPIPPVDKSKFLVTGGLLYLSDYLGHTGYNR